VFTIYVWLAEHCAQVFQTCICIQALQTRIIHRKTLETIHTNPVTQRFSTRADHGATPCTNNAQDAALFSITRNHGIAISTMDADRLAINLCEKAGERRIN
jgi:hypothetical protein